MDKRKRHRILRWLGWGIGAFASGAAIILLLVAAYLVFADYEEQLRTVIEEQLTEVSGAPAVIRSITLDLLRYRFDLEGVLVRTPASETPILELGRVSGKLRLPELLSLRVLWEDLHFDGLTLHLMEDREEGLVLSGGTLEARPFSGLALAADRISVSNGILIVANERVPWQLDATNLSLSVTRTGPASYEGTLDYDPGLLQIKDHPDVQASLTAVFELHPSELLLREGTVSSGIGQVSFTGKLGFADGARGRMALTAEGDAARVAESLFGVENASAWASGRGSFRGSLLVEPDNKVLQGTVVVPTGELAGIPISDWTGEVFWDRSLLQVSYARGTFASGAARIQLHQPLPAAEHRAALEWEVDSASLAHLIEGWTGRTSPIDSIVSGRGGLSLAVEAPDGGESRFELRGAPPAISATATPVSFQMRGRLVPKGVEIDDASFGTGFLSGTLSGTYPADGPARISLEAEATDLLATDVLQRELRRAFLDGSSAEPRLWDLSGRAQIRGELTATRNDVVFEGDLSSQDLRYHSVLLGALRSRVVVSPDAVRFEDLVAGEGNAGMAGRATFSPRLPFPERSLELELTISKWPIEGFAGPLGTPVSVTGLLSGRVHTLRVASGLEGSALLELEDGTVAGLPFETGETQLTLEGSRIRFDPLRLQRASATLSGRVEIDTDGEIVAGALDTRSYPLAGLGPDWAELSGTVEGKLEVSGNVDAPQVLLSGRGRDIQLRGVELGEAFISGRVRDDDLLMTLTLESEARELAVQLAIDLDAPPLLARGTARWHQIDAGGWLGLPEGTRALADGVASFRLPLHSSDATRAAEAEIELEAVSIEGDAFGLQSLAPIELRLREGRLELPGAVLGEGATTLNLGGGIDLAEGSLDIQIDGAVSFGALETLYPSLGLSTTGETFVSARITGTRASPAINGYADFRGGSIRFSAFRQAVAELDGRIVFDNRTLRIPRLTGVFGSGPVEISGSIVLAGVSPATVDLSLRGSGVRLRYPEGFGATLDGELALLGSADERILSGALVLSDAVWTREYDLVSGILSDREGLSLFDDLAANEIFRNLRLDVAVTAPESLKVRNSIATIEGSAELELRGTVSEPVILGRSEAQRGELYFLGQRYNITTGKVDFVDPTRIEPFVDLTAETRVRSYRVELRITGTPQRIHPELSSDPPLRTVDILRLLAGANERDIFIGNEEEELAGVGVASLLTERLTQEVGKRAERLFGLDRFSINPFLVGQFANPTARVSLGKQFTRELSINYSTNLNATTEAIILIEYTPEGPMSWILSRDEEGDVGIDVKFRKSF